MPIDTHVRVAAWLHIALGILWVSIGAFFGLFFGAFAAFMGAAAHGSAAGVLALIAGFGLLVILFCVKVSTKIIGVWPACLASRIPRRESVYTTLMMSTGLTFGSISALFGFNYGYIDQAQYSILVTVVIASAVIPTVIAQVFFQPREAGLKKWVEIVRQSRAAKRAEVEDV